MPRKTSFFAPYLFQYGVFTLSIGRFHALNTPFLPRQYAVFTQVKKGNKEQIIWVLHFFVVILQPI